MTKMINKCRIDLLKQNTKQCIFIALYGLGCFLVGFVFGVFAITPE